MSETKHTYTPAPWRWEINLKHKSVQLVGGKTRYDLCVMGFARYGMGAAAPLFVEPSEPGSGLMILKRADEFAAIVEGREHHASWFQTINHPDAQLIAAAPTLAEVLEEADQYLSGNAQNYIGSGSVLHQKIRAALAAGGLL